MRIPDRETRDRVLTTAARLFARRGFKRVTVREICRAANANVAAVNYHFGDKLGLYREVLQAAVDAMRSTLASARATGAGGAPDRRLQAYVQAFLERLAASGRDSWIHQLLSRELADPTPALDFIVREAMRPRLLYLAGLVAELLDRPSDDACVVQCAHSIHALCVALIPNPVAARLDPGMTLTADTVAALADHVTSFSLAGLQAFAGHGRGSRAVRQTVGRAVRVAGVGKRFR